MLQFELNDRNIKAPLDYQVHLPLHQTDQNDERRNFKLSDLFLWATNIDEPQSLAIDENGEKKRLSINQLETVREEAQLSVPSRKYPDRYHVWKLNRIIQEGSLYTKMVFQETLSSSLDYLIVSIPENIFDNPDHLTDFSAQKGVELIYRGILAMVSSVIGLVEEIPKHSENEVSRMVEEKRVEFIKKSIAADSFLDTSIFRSCLYDEALTQTVEVDLARIREEHRVFWSSNVQMMWKQAIQKLTITYPEADRSNPHFLTDRVNEDMENQRLESLNECFRSDILLNQISPGYGDLLANQLSAAKITSDEDKKRHQLILSKSIVIREQISKQHPVLSQIEGWMAPRFNRQIEEYTKEVEVTMKNDIARRLAENGLQLELYLISESVKFEKEEGESYRSQLSSMKVPTKIIKFFFRIWRSKNWTRDVDSDSARDAPIYHFHEYMTKEIPTDRIFWRLRVAIHRVKYFLNDGLYGVLVQNLMNGVLGLRAMSLTSHSFYPLKTLNKETGEIHFDRDTLCPTYMGNLDATLTRYHMARDAFENAPDQGLLGKGITRPFFVIYKVLLCIASLLVIGVGQPILTILNLAASILVTVTSPVWAVLLSILCLVFNFLVVDMDYPSGRTFFYFPIPAQALYVMFMGVGQVIFKFAQCVVFDFPMFILEGTFAYVRYGARKVLDAFMMSILQSRMKIPGVDSFWAKRIKGPGMSNSYFYQVEPEVAIAALHTTLQLEELNFFVTAETAEVKKPLQDFNNFFKDLIAPLTIDASKLPETLQLQAEERTNLEVLRLATRTRYLELARGSLDKNVVSADRIKLTTENLEDTLMRSEEIVTSFYRERVSRYINPNESMKYWTEKSLFEDDFKGLTAHYYGTTFHGQFLVPLQVTDDDFMIRVIQPSLEDVVSNFPHSYQRNSPPFMQPSFDERFNPHIFVGQPYNSTV